MSEKLLRAAIRPNGVLWKNALAEYERMCERRDWVRQRVLSMVLEERLIAEDEDNVWELYLLGGPRDDDDETSERYVAVFQVHGDLDDPANLKLRS